MTEVEVALFHKEEIGDISNMVEYLTDDMERWMHEVFSPKCSIFIFEISFNNKKITSQWRAN